MSASYSDQFQRLDGPNQRGNSRLLVADLAYPFAESRAFSLIGHMSLGDWKSQTKRSGDITQRDRLQVARAWLEFTRVSKTRIDGRIGLSKGLDFGSGIEKGDPLASRPNAGTKFTKFTAELQVAVPVSQRFTLRANTAAQYSTKSLLSPEEFALGGSRIGRAFDFNEVTGDHGVGAMAELSYRLGDIKGGPKTLELFAFADGGGAFRKHESLGLPEEQWLADAGAGVRFSALGFFCSGEFGVPISRSRADRDPRAFFSVTKSF
jgi:hemolysin activation/secretion protein